MWRREMDCLLSVCDYIVEFFPSKEMLPDGTTREVRTEKLKPHSLRADALMLFWRRVGSFLP
jgi:hypothetical protein